MKCRQARMYASPYFDSEFDPTTTYEVSRHLQACAECARLFAAEGELEGAIGARLQRPRGDEGELVERVLARVLDRPGRSIGWGLPLAAACVLLVAGLVAQRLIPRWLEDVPALVEMAAKDHRRYLLGEIAPTPLAQDPEALAFFFRGQLTGETGLLPSGDGWEVEGARVCRFRGVSVGYVILRYHGIPVSVVDVPGEDVERAVGDGSASAHDERCFEVEGGRGILRRTPFGVRVAFGDVEMAKLEEVVRAAR